MKALGLLLVGIVLGGLAGYFGLWPKPIPPGNSMLMLRTGGDTVIINVKRDTVIINAKKDTIIINALTSEYCDQKPKPKGCPPD